MALTRATSRRKLAEILKGSLTEAQLVLPYQKSKFEGASPVVQVASGGSRRAALTARGIKSTFLLGIHVFVLHSDTESGWTEENAEDMLDLLESKIAATIESYKTIKDVWQSIEWAGDSLVDKVVLADGLAYLYEVIPVSVEVY